MDDTPLTPPPSTGDTAPPLAPNAETDASSEDGPLRRSGAWPETMWSLVLAAGAERISPEVQTRAEAAFASLCEIYREPIKYWFQRKRRQDAEDLTHSFLIRLKGGEKLRRVKPGQTNFRSYLVACLRHHLINQWTVENGQPDFIPFEDPGLPSEEADLTLSFDRQIALNIHRRALAVVEAQYEKRHQGARFRALSQFLLHKDSSVSYRQIAHQLGMVENNVSKAVSDLRDAWAREFQAQTRHLVGSELESRDEVKHMLRLLVEGEVGFRPSEVLPAANDPDSSTAPA